MRRQRPSAVLEEFIEANLSPSSPSYLHLLKHFGVYWVQGSGQRLSSGGRHAGERRYDACPKAAYMLVGDSMCVRIPHQHVNCSSKRDAMALLRKKLTLT